jgi:hypothetical protein
MNINITLQKQTKSRNCGQTAVSMLLNAPMADVEKAYGRARALELRRDPTKARRYSGTTNMFMTRRAVDMLGGYAGELTACDSKAKLPETALVRIVFQKRSGGALCGKVKKMGHLVVWANGQFYDPCGTTYTELPAGTQIDRFIEVLVP